MKKCKNLKKISISVIMAVVILICAVLSVNAEDNTQGTAPEFIRGVDISSYFSLKNSGVEFKDFSGNPVDNDGFFELLRSCGINCIRVRIWNDPYDKDGNGYGGGNCDIENACKIGELAANHGIKILADFHLSDFWADPSQQTPPKAWRNYTLEKKKAAVYDYVFQSLQSLKACGADLSMVQIGNEINSGLCGETEFSNVAELLKSGFKAVSDSDKSILRVVHFTDPQKNAFDWFASTLKSNGVDYDVFASSYYPYWHGTVQNLTSQLKKVADKYSKYVMCAETAYPFTSEDSDFFSNNVSGTESALKYPVSVNGQTQALKDVFNAVKAVGDRGIGVFYWEPAWITVGTSSYEDNYSIWESCGSGWESSFASEYCDDSAMWHGGSSWDNQALFNKDGAPLDSLKVFAQFAEKALGDVDGDGTLSVIDATLILKHITQLAELSSTQQSLADVDGDEDITVLDATLIQKIITGLVNQQSR